MLADLRGAGVIEHIWPTTRCHSEKYLRKLLLDTVGTGHYVGCVLSIDNFNASNQTYTWPGEGDDMIFIDGEVWPPSLHGTGTEDYFNAAWDFRAAPTPTRTTGSPWRAARRSTSACGACTASTSRTRCGSADRSA